MTAGTGAGFQYSQHTARACHLVYEALHGIRYIVHRLILSPWHVDKVCSVLSEVSRGDFSIARIAGWDRGPMNSSLILTMKNKSGNGFDAAEIFDFEIVDINWSIEILFYMEQQFDEALGIENAGSKQIGFDRRHFDVHDFGK
jgi:hypothetical protein